MHGSWEGTLREAVGREPNLRARFGRLTDRLEDAIELIGPDGELVAKKLGDMTQDEVRATLEAEIEAGPIVVS